MKKVVIEFQYFESCPNHKKLYENLLSAISDIDEKIILRIKQVIDEKDARAIKFRGSPTILINGEDLENMPEPDFPTLSCRFYANGLPDSETIKKNILKYLSQN